MSTPSRRDFSQLSLLLAQAAQSPSAAGESKGEAGVDRIILFIDDLDRCPENIVVDVLQAVHLLLAFPLFVVVVAVDSRWLLHSLRQHSQALADDDVDVASPVNYLEKIFQIPFRLRPHGGGRGFDRLIDTLTAPAKHEESPAPDPSPDPARADQTVKPPPPGKRVDKKKSP